MRFSETDDSTFHLVARRNDSLTARGRKAFFISMVIVSLGIAVGWAIRGAWAIIPFALLELAVLYVALRIIERHSGDFEKIVIIGDRLTVERSERGRVVRHELNVPWATLVIRREGVGGRVAIAVRSHGKEVGVGDFLTDEQRVELAGELRRRLRQQ
ncbi:MAG: DUF2244 domain-containing protein [Betaproteobacteria bacterium]